MGRPKALLEFGGRTALAICADALQNGGCDPVIAVLGSGAEEIRAKAGLPEGVRVVVHPGWAAGRTGSLKAGLAAAATAPAFVVLPVDHPLVARDDVAALVAAWAADRPPVVRPVHGGRGGHPVLLDASLLPEILALGDDDPLRDVVRKHRDRERTVPGSAGTSADLNTPEDVRRALGTPKP